MDPTEVSAFYDFCWFEMEILKTSNRRSIPSTDSPPDSPTLASMYLQIQKQQSPPPPPPPEFASLRPRLLNRSAISRSTSEDLYSKPTFTAGSGGGRGGFSSPDSVLTPHLRTILSGKAFSIEDLEIGEELNDSSPAAEELNDSTPPPPPPPPRRKPRKAGKKLAGSKSLTSLEIEELKGFMDLGFVFSEEDKDSNLASILPGLQRLGKTEEKLGKTEERPRAVAVAFQRPYLSEAWAAGKRKMVKKPSMNWKVPAVALGNEIELKDSLKLWAHSVASTVR